MLIDCNRTVTERQLHTVISLYKSVYLEYGGTTEYHQNIFPVMHGDEG